MGLCVLVTVCISQLRAKRGTGQTRYSCKTRTYSNHEQDDEYIFKYEKNCINNSIVFPSTQRQQEHLSIPRPSPPEKKAAFLLLRIVLPPHFFLQLITCQQSLGRHWEGKRGCAISSPLRAILRPT